MHCFKTTKHKRAWFLKQTDQVNHTFETLLASQNKIPVPLAQTLNYSPGKPKISAASNERQEHTVLLKGLRWF